MSNTATIPTHLNGDRLDAIEAGDVIDLLAPRPAVDINCWRLLTARVPLTLLLDLALPSTEELAELYDELLDEHASIEWVPAPRASRDR
jgi:8-oxo-dGTP pyrophosphatase MutT (NUDIX family)